MTASRSERVDFHGRLERVQIWTRNTINDSSQQNFHPSYDIYNSKTWIRILNTNLDSNMNILIFNLIWKYKNLEH